MVYHSTKKKTTVLLAAYVNVYDEIVQGYESDTRTRYVKDQECEGVYRKLTMSEE